MNIKFDSHRVVPTTNKRQSSEASGEVAIGDVYASECRTITGLVSGYGFYVCCLCALEAMEEKNGEMLSM